MGIEKYRQYRQDYQIKSRIKTNIDYQNYPTHFNKIKSKQMSTKF